MSTRVSIDLGPVIAESLASWKCDHVAAAVVSAYRVVGRAGDHTRVLPWASVTKIVAALAVLDVVHEGLVDLDEPAGPVGSTVRHLLGHASGWAFDDEKVMAQPGTRRIYSNVGIDAAVTLACARTGAVSHAELLSRRVLRPVGMTASTIEGSAAHGGRGPVDDVALLARELLVPRALDPWVVSAALTPSFPDLAGVLPGFGRQTPNDWGLGVELRGHKSPHWMPPNASPNAAGHFGQAGSFLWVDRAAGVGAVALTGTAFGPWAVSAWPQSSERWLAEWLSSDVTSGGAA